MEKLVADLLKDQLAIVISSCFMIFMTFFIRHYFTRIREDLDDLRNEMRGFREQAHDLDRDYIEVKTHISYLQERLR